MVYAMNEQQSNMEKMELNEEKGQSAPLDEASEKELRALKLWLFSENIRIETEKRKLQDMQNRFIRERQQFQEEMKVLNQAILSSRKQLKQDELFFQKKMDILQNGFRELDEDRKDLERERERFRTEQLSGKSRNTERSTGEADKRLLFAGVHNALALKKRYRDLLKIYHPDNVAGDSSAVLYINQEYERLSREL